MLRFVSTTYFKVELIKTRTTILRLIMKRNIRGQVKQNNEINSGKASESKTDNFSVLFQQKRESTAESILKFDFQKKRVRILSEAKIVAHPAESVVYWMSRDARVQDNWAFLFAQRLALKNSLPLQVCFCLVPKFLDATIRHYKFLLKGLEEVSEECKKLDIRFNLLCGPAGDKIPEFVRNKKVGAVVCDFSPLRVPQKWLEDVKSKLPPDVPLCQVDAHNIVPVWEASGKKEYAARTIRGKITKQLENYLTEFPPLIKHPHIIKGKHQDVDWKTAYHSLECNKDVEEVTWAQPGYSAACDQLMKFCTNRLARFSDKRNDPVEDCLSNLSPWFHFGHIAVQRCITVVKEYKGKYTDSVAAFCEEAIIRRELSDNFCFYNEKYDSIEGLDNWAIKTLNDHRLDKRSHIYTKEELENSRTHDDLWNSAQIQLVKEAKMHGFLRMYWAKKILEWTETPEQALEIAIYLNDKYSLDGRDPSGYVGCMWSIGGVHDHGWTERPVFGKIRYMNYQGCKRKFDVSAFVARYGGKVHTKT